MRRIGAILFGILVGGGLVLAAFQLHVVRAAEGLVIVPKQQPALTDVYADIRDWSRDDWQQHPVLVQSSRLHQVHRLLHHTINRS